MASGGKIPGAGRARVDRAKVIDYLLDPERSGGKAGFFHRCGFSRAGWRRLARALLEHGRRHRPIGIVETGSGTRYIVEGVMETPDGSSPLVRTVWVKEGKADPRLITAYPLGRKP